MSSSAGMNGLNILHKAFLIGQIIVAAVSIFIVYSKMIVPPAKEMDKLFQVIAIIVAAAGYFSGKAIFKNKLIQIDEMQSAAKEKFERYRSASIIKWTLLEGPSILTSSFWVKNHHQSPTTLIK